MDETYRQMVVAMCSKKFGRKQELKSVVKPQQGLSAEREYKRLAKEVNNEMFEIIKENMPLIIDIFKRRYETGQRYDSDDDDLSDLDKIFEKVRLKIKKLAVGDKLRKRITNIANVRRKLTVREWKRVCKRTLGVNILSSYYEAGIYRKIVDNWIDQNVNLIESIPFEEFDKMRQMVFDSWYDSITPKELTEKIQQQWGVTKSRAELIALDQTLKLNGEITKQQHEDAGVTEYIWYTTGDSRVRDDHRKLHGTRQKWSSPPVVDARTGRRGHPGDDYRCRCVAIPVFDKNNLNLPIENVDWEAVDERTAQYFKKEMSGRSGL